MALPPTARSRYNTKKKTGDPRDVPFGFGLPSARVRDPFTGFSFTRPGPMSERERDPAFRTGTRDPYYGQRVIVAPPEGDDSEYEWDLPDYKDALYNQEMDELLRSEEDAKARQATLQRTALIRLGSKSLASQILGAQDPALAGISDDPNTSFSTMAQIAREGLQLRENINNTRNDQNLWFSSTRGNDLTRAAYEQQLANTNATQDVQDYLGNLTSDLTGALRDITFQRMAAEAAARDRAMQMWILGGGKKKKKGGGEGGAGAPVVPGAPTGSYPADPIYNVPGGRPYPI